MRRRPHPLQVSRTSRALAACLLTMLAAIASCGQHPATPGAANLTLQTPGPDEQSTLGQIGDEELPPAAPSEAFSSGITNTPTDAEAATYLMAVANDLDATWTAYFRTVNAREPFVTYKIVQPGEEAVSRCGGNVGTYYNNAFYCDDDIDPGNGWKGQIVLPLRTFERMWGGSIFGRSSPQIGDFAAAAVEAHEFGHHVQAELRDQLRLPDIVGPNGQKIKQKELIADCFAGTWTYSAYYKGYLEGADVEEALDALTVIGDAQEGGADPHGSPQERANAFSLGYNTGAPANCINTYWPGVQAS
jgi:uncharacterized protein